MSPSLLKYGAAAALAVASGVASQAVTTYKLTESFTPDNFFDDDKFSFFVVWAHGLLDAPGCSADQTNRASLTAHPRRSTRHTALSTTRARPTPGTWA